MIDPSRELFKWGPVDAKIIYIDIVMQAMPKCVGFLSVGWPDILLHIKDGKGIAVADYANVRNNGKILFTKHVLDEKELKKHYFEWNVVAGKLLSFEEMMDVNSLARMDDDNLKALFMSWFDIYMDFWVKGFLPELSNWGGEQLLKEKLIESNKENFIMLFERLSAPEDISFFQTEELDLLKIKLIEDEALQREKLKEHQRKYFWLNNSYGHVEVLDIPYFEKRLNAITKEQAVNLIDRITNFPKKTKEEKEQLIRKFNLSSEISKIGKGVSFCVWWQDLRKKYIFIANHYTRSLLEELSKRLKISLDELEAHTFPEIVDLISKNKRINYSERSKGFLEYFHEGGNHLEYFYGEVANEIIRRYTEVKIAKEIKEIRGTVVSLGHAKGKAKIILTPREIDKLKDGDVLVAPMTSPDYITAMRRASAIITDEGGMTCHAAIISRELGTPCIVATRIATKVLKDGDFVEVDAEKGLVRIIKKVAKWSK